MDALKKRPGRIATVVMSVAIAAGASIFAAPAANAYPSQCVSGMTTSNGGYATCSHGSGSFQVVLGCKNIFGFYKNPTGPWRKVGQSASTQGCPIGYSVQWAGFNAKD